MNAVKFVLRTWAVLALALMPVGVAAEVRTESPAGGKGEIVICRGVEAHTCGPMVKIGQEAPDFRAVNAALEEVSLSSYRGKRVILNIFPSLDTPTCAMSVSSTPVPRNWRTPLCSVCRWTYPCTVTLLHHRRAGKRSAALAVSQS